SILDLGLTLEYLETKGVPVIGYGTNQLPAFYTRESGFKLNYRMDSPLEIAKAIKVKRDLDLKGSMVIANPIPLEHAMDSRVISEAIGQALEEAKELGISGKDITPYLLDKVQKITGGKSLEANIQLVYNNASLAAQVAVELSKI
ncbi:MAG: pseudouridine-5'-phosphate glycosidase, partial [Tissierellaceae bacterium]